MEIPLLLKIVVACLMGFMIWRMIPAAKHFFEHGPKGTTQDWMTTAMLLGGVVLFVVLLIAMVR